MIVRRERPEDEGELARLLDAAFDDTPTGVRPDRRRGGVGKALVRAAIGTYDASVRGRVEYPALFPPPPDA